MASNLANLNIQYENYANYWMKLYEPATNNAKIIYNDTDETSAFDKLQINIDGFLITIPHANGFYDAYLFPTESDANKNITTNAIKIADNISADKLTAADITTASEVDLGLVKLASEQDVIDYVVDLSDGALNGTPPAPEKVMNIQRAYEMIQQASGGGGLETGDTMLKDISVGDANTDFLKQNGNSFDPLVYPDLALLTDYQSGENITSVDTETLNEIVASATYDNEGYRFLKISDTEYWGVTRQGQISTSRIDMVKSIDAGLTWTTLPDPVINAASFQAKTGIAWNGSDEIMMVAGPYSFVFNIVSEIWVVNRVTIKSGSTYGPIDVHYNSNLSKWIVILGGQKNSSTSENNIHVYSSVDGVSWVLESQKGAGTVNTASVNGGLCSSNLDGRGGMSYKNGYYYLGDGANKIIYKFDETDFSDSVVFDYSTLITGTAQNALAAIAITNSSNFAVVVANTATSYEIAVSNSGDLGNWSIITYTPSLYTSFTINDLPCKLAPITGETFVLISPSTIPIDKYISITNNFFTSELYTRANIDNSLTNSVIYNESNDNILIDIPSSSASNDHSILSLNVTGNLVYKTKNLIDIYPAGTNLAYYVKK